MRIIVAVKTRAKEAKVVKIDDGHYRVWVTASPEKGKANVAMVKLLADYLGVASSNIRIVMGKTSKEKLVDII